MLAIRTIEELERIYGELDAVGEASTAKIADHITPQYRRFNEAAPFVALATSGPEGLDCSPRGMLQGSCALPTRVRCCFPIAGATTGSTACATSYVTRALG